jgi:uncharacterized lipoprotein YehR (DUF1307 family)
MFEHKKEKTMKKIAALLLAVMLMLSLAACGDEPAPNVDTDKTTTPATTTPATTEAEEPRAQLGTVEGTVYTNTFLGITADMGADWTFAPKSDLAQILGMATENITDEDLLNALESSGVIYDMYAVNNDGMQNINITMENLNVLQSLAVTEQAYLEASKDQLAPALEDMGYENVTVTLTEIEFAGKSHAALKLHGTISDMDFYETLVCIKQGSYIACVTVGAFGTDTTGAILALFSAA